MELILKIIVFGFSFSLIGLMCWLLILLKWCWTEAEDEYLKLKEKEKEKLLKEGLSTQTVLGSFLLKKYLKKYLIHTFATK